MPKLESYMRSATRASANFAWLVGMRLRYDKKLQRVCLAALIFSVLMLLRVDRVSAEHTEIQLEFTPTIRLGEPLYVSVVLTDEGRRLANQPVTLSINNRTVGQTRTGDVGLANFRVVTAQFSRTGDYTVRVSYDGMIGHGVAQSAGILSVEPATVVVQTVPPIAGLRFALDNQIFVSNAAGVAQTVVSELRPYQLEALMPAPSRYLRSDVAVQFNQWQDQRQSRTRSLNIANMPHLQAGFDISQPLPTSFIAADGTPIDSTRIESLTLRNSRGETQTITQFDDAWLPTTHIEHSAETLQSNPISYTLTELRIDGSNALQDSAQPFPLPADGVAQVESNLVSVRLSAENTILHRPAGQGIALEYPDGTQQNFLFDANRSVQLSGLVRGQYYARVFGTGGFAPRTPLLISSDNTIRLLVLGQFEVGLSLAGFLLVTSGLFLMSHPQLLSSLTQKLPNKLQSTATLRGFQRYKLFWTASLTSVAFVCGAVLIFGVGTLAYRVNNQVFVPIESTDVLPLPSAEIVVFSAETATSPTATPTAIFIANFPSAQPTKASRANNAIPAAIPITLPDVEEDDMRVHATPPQRDLPATASASPAPPTVPAPVVTPTPTPRIHLVRENETLVGLANQYYNDPNAWDIIWRANREKLDSPQQVEPWDLIFIPYYEATPYPPLD